MSQRLMNTISKTAAVADSIRQSLTKTFPKAVFVNVLNESAGHNVQAGSETHFSVVVASEEFHGLNLIKRHRLVNKALETQLLEGVHALRINAKTLEEFENLDKEKLHGHPPSCRGGGV